MSPARRAAIEGQEAALAERERLWKMRYGASSPSVTTLSASEVRRRNRASGPLFSSTNQMQPTATLPAWAVWGERDGVVAEVLPTTMSPTTAAVPWWLKWVGGGGG